MTPSAFIFDLDGTLIDSNRMYFRLWSEILQERGYEFSEEIFMRFTGRKRTETAQILAEHYGSDFPFEDLLQVRIARAAAEMQTAGVPLMKGAAELVKALYEKGYPLGLVTSTPRKEAAELLSRAGIWKYFFAAVGGDEVKNGKPDPEGYLLCAERIGCVPAACLAFEDTEMGVQAAADAGMRVIMVPDLLQPSEDVRRVTWAVLNSLDEVERFMGVCWS